MERLICANVLGEKLSLETCAGLFSPEHVDRGTLAMLSAAVLTPGMKVLDLGCGCGVVGIAAAKKCGAENVWMLDANPLAVDTAARNAERNGVSGVHIVLSDGFRTLDEAGFDLILSNPPYLTGEDMQNLQKAVGFEPSMALYGGEDGLDFYRRLAAGAKDHLNPGGWMLLEVGMGQAEAVAGMLESALGCDDAVIIDDLNGVGRVVKAQRPVA